MCWVLTRSWWMSVYLKLKWSLCAFIELQSPETSFSLFRAWTDYLGSRKSRIQERCVSDWLVKGNRVGCGRREICASSRSIYACCEVDQCPQNTVNSEISQMYCVPCLRDSGILLTAWVYVGTPDPAKDKGLVVESVDLYVCMPVCISLLGNLM